MTSPGGQRLPYFLCIRPFALISLVFPFTFIFAFSAVSIENSYHPELRSRK